MIDRFGKSITVGWADHEELWVAAALTLKGEERTNALWDIAELTGRSIHAVQRKAEHVASQKRLDDALRAMVPSKVMVPAFAKAPLAKHRRAA